MSRPSCLDRLSRALAELPGVGRRSAERMALAIARDPALAGEMATSLREVSETICGCERCGAITGRDENPCRLCTDTRRDGTIICVVEEPTDIVLIEKTGYRGRYHALMGKISPMEGQGPADLRIEALLRRVADEGVREVILALNTDVESDATAQFVADQLRSCGVRLSRLAFGLPVGSGIAYTDAVTLSRAFQGRQGM